MSVTGPCLPSTAPQMTLTFAPLLLPLRHLRAFDVAVPGVHHFVRFRKVGPELKTFHNAVIISKGHFLVYDAAAGRHPLHIS